MRVRPLLLALATLLVLTGLGPVAPAAAQAAPIPELPNLSLKRFWARADFPVAAGATQRSYYFGYDGPDVFTCQEEYRGSPRGLRFAYYFDKARLEQADWEGTTPVTAGLLTRQLISGRLQVGDNDFIEGYGPAAIPVAGDADSSAPTYASFQRISSIEAGSNRAPGRVGATVTATLARDGAVGDDGSLGRYGVTIGEYSDALGHNVPGVFLDFFARTGPIGQVDDNGNPSVGGVETLINAIEVMGLPISEPYWAVAPVGGTPRWVLMQAFERRVVTYTPDNDPAYRVEMGNVGKHFKDWLYPEGTCKRRQPAGAPPPPQAAGGQVVFGPINGALEHVADSAIIRRAGVNRRNLEAEARFFNPYGANEGKWSYGFGFRDTGRNQQLRLVIDSDREWALVLAEVVNNQSRFTTLQRGGIGNLNMEANAVNVVKLTANDNAGTLTVNGAQAATLDLSRKLAAGDVFIGTGFYSDYKIPGRVTRYEGFVVRALPESGAPVGGPSIQVAPATGNAGTTFSFAFGGFQANESVGFWFTDPTGEVWYPGDRTVKVNANGAFGFQLIPNRAFSRIAPGRWAITARGVTSNREAVGYFEIR